MRPDVTTSEVARDWVKQLTSAIREVDDRHMITVGVIPWAQVFKGAKPLFYATEVGEPLDFVSVHFYPKAGEVPEALTALAVYEVGKPLLIEEMFPLSCSIEQLQAFIDGSRNMADGWVSFYWGKTIEEYEQQGDLRGAVIAGWLRTVSVTVALCCETGTRWDGEKQFPNRYSGGRGRAGVCRVFGSAGASLCRF